MNAKETLNKIKIALGVETEVKLEQAKLQDGEVTIEADAFEAGNDVFVIADDERVPMPIGEYVLEDGRTLVVEQDGVIASIGEAQAEEEEENAEPVAEEEVEMETEEKQTPKKIVENISKEMHFSDEQKNILKEMFTEWYQELSAQKEEEVPNEVIEQVKEELSAPATKPIKHNPSKSAEKKDVKLYANNRPRTTIDRVLEKFNNK